jgi:hypothetical protein
MAMEGTNHHMDDAMDASDTRSGTPDTEIIVGDENLLFGNNLRSMLNAGGDGEGENNESRNDLRSRLDDDEQFLESPELYQDVSCAVSMRWDVGSYARTELSFDSTAVMY